jgi:phage shock protein PspC (stress-responsive transcriptional regulator)
MRWLPVMLGCLVAGLALMLAFDSWITRLLGVVALFAFIVIGVFLIADPAFLAEEEKES